MIRAAIEGVAARLVVERNVDISELDSIMEAMRILVREPDIRRILECALRFHITLCVVREQVPAGTIRAFNSAAVRLHLHARRGRAHRTPEPWARNVPIHDRIMEALRSGDAYFAEQYVHRPVLGFGRLAKQVWAGEERARGAAAD